MFTLVWDAGSATGLSLHLAAYPLAEAVFGSGALLPLVMLDVVNHVAGVESGLGGGGESVRLGGDGGG